MTFIFYCSGIFAVISTLFVFLNRNPMYSLLYLIISFLSISCVFFSLQAFFAGAIEIIIYVGAIMVLFVFVVMMLNTQNIFGINKKSLKNHFVSPVNCLFSLISAGIILIMLLYIILSSDKKVIDISPQSIIEIKNVGIRFFNEYFLAVEIASMLLLSSLVIVYHLSDLDFSKNLFNKKNED